jgi:Rrf2 family protein
VNLSAKTEYACLAVLELALRHDCGQPVRVRTIAEQHGIPSGFLVQILLQLKGAGLVASTRGIAGGYQLAQDPGEITLGDVRRVIEGRKSELTGNAGAETRVSRTLLAAWRRIAAVERQLLDATTFADLAAQLLDPAESMYYI